MQGDLEAATAAAQQALHFAIGPDGSRLPTAIIALGVLARIHYEQNQLELAADLLIPTVAELRDTNGFIKNPLDTVLPLIMLKQACREESAARQILREATQQRLGLPFSDAFRLCLAAIDARLSLTQGNLRKALAWADSWSIPSTTDKLRPILVFPYLTWVRIRLVQQVYAEADDFLARLLVWTQANGLNGFVLEVTLLQALSQFVQDRLEEALRYLEITLDLAKSQRYIRLYVDEGQPISQLLRQAISRGLMVDYALELLAHFDTEEAVHEHPQSPVNGNTALIEPLSSREFEVLHLIDAGHTNQQIADELIIAVSTVKRHINNIYGKLHAQNRTHALARAREMKLM
ncbi:LuxR C-terminal-related transcriptional regulator [Chloroflexi bacterium TSY]|nr:LuxR C-terminal-related transcriptional regulator [Chloroflexi bacterium TSY]